MGRTINKSLNKMNSKCDEILSYCGDAKEYHDTGSIDSIMRCIGEIQFEIDRLKTNNCEIS